MICGAGMRNFLGLEKSSLISQFPTSTSFVVGLYSSIASTSGNSVWLTTSLTRMGANVSGAPAGASGVPSNSLLGRHDSLRSHVYHGAFSSTMTSDNPRPSVIGYQELLYEKSRTFSPTASSSRTLSPPLSSEPM